MVIIIILLSLQSGMLSYTQLWHHKEVSSFLVCSNLKMELSEHWNLLPKLVLCSDMKSPCIPPVGWHNNNGDQGQDMNGDE